MTWITAFFGSYVEIPRIKIGERQTVETLINEEALLFSKFLRNEQEIWIPRTVDKSHVTKKKEGDLV